MALTSPAGAATRDLKLEDYKYFRALSIDLMGRMPTRKEIAEFEKPEFSLDAWLDQHLRGEDYADRLTRIYADIMRPQINQFRYNQTRMSLASVTYLNTEGKLTRLYWRPSQVRKRITDDRAELNRDPNFVACAAIRDPVRDPKYVELNCAQYEYADNLLKAGMCLNAHELGVRHTGSSNVAPTPYPPRPGDTAGMTPRDAADEDALDRYTKVVKPWWLYADYRNPNPTARYNAADWATKYPGFVPNTALLKEPGNTVDTMEIRVCNEELQGTSMAPADTLKNPDGTPLMVDCRTAYGAANSSACGCGPGLEWCLPSATYNTTFPAAAFISSRNVLLGVDDPTDQVGFTFFDWHQLWLGEEPLVFLRRLFDEDGDLREMVTGRYTYVNGPLAQFYNFPARTTIGDRDLGQVPIPNPGNLPADLLPFETSRWVKVMSNSPNTAGLLTQPWFTMKNATRRARGNAVWGMFMCRDFSSPPGLQLTASKDPNLMTREGCAVCHHTLEPLAAYFARTPESDWNWLDAKTYPTQNASCKKPSGTGSIPGACNTRYDNQFSTIDFGMLRGAYGAPENADAGPAGLGQWLAAQPDYAACAVKNIATSFLGRELRTEDAELKQSLVKALTENGFRARPMVKALLNSKAYRSANNLASGVWRNGGK